MANYSSNAQIKLLKKLKLSLKPTTTTTNKQTKKIGKRRRRRRSWCYMSFGNAHIIIIHKDEFYDS